jgi:hypothetical protein
MRGRASVKARAPGHDFTCAGDGLEGEVTVEGDRIVRATATFPLEHLDAGDALGNRELRKFLSFDRRPKVTGELRDPIPIRTSGDRIAGEGRLALTIEGPTALVSVRFEGRLPRVSITLSPTFTGLGYQPPKLLFLKVKDELTVEIAAEATIS